MTATATLTVTGSVQSTPTGSKTFAGSINSSAACAVTQSLVLQTGANTVTLPTAPAPTGCLIQLPVGNTSVVTLKGVTGDTGIAIGKVGIILLTWDPAALPTSFVLTSVSTQTGLSTEISFF